MEWQTMIASYARLKLHQIVGLHGAQTMRANKLGMLKQAVVEFRTI